VDAASGWVPVSQIGSDRVSQWSFHWLVTRTHAAARQSQLAECLGHSESSDLESAATVTCTCDLNRALGLGVPHAFVLKPFFKFMKGGNNFLALLQTMKVKYKKLFTFDMNFNT
jgi:hypothetical protein